MELVHCECGESVWLNSRGWPAKCKCGKDLKPLKSKTDDGAEVPCSGGLSCPLLDECDAISEAIGDKQILASALREIYNIRGEDKDIDRIVNEALLEACAT